MSDNIPFADGSGRFVTTFASGTIIIPFNTTNTVSITPPLGERVRLTSIVSGGAKQTNLTTLSIGGVDVVTDVELSRSGVIDPSSNEFSIGYGTPSQEPITGGIDQVLEIKTNVARSQSTGYSYQFGD